MAIQSSPLNVMTHIPFEIYNCYHSHNLPLKWIINAPHLTYDIFHNF